MLSRIALRALMGASFAAIAVTATPASAQRVDSITAFGDSYADDGNLFQIIGFNPAPQVYPTGRFSGGTNYIDTLGQILNVPIYNFAIGGANSDNTNVNGPGIPGFATEWNAYLAGGGGPFPTVDGTFDANDLVTFSIGGNDARFYQRNGGTLAGVPTAVAGSVAYATAGIDALVDAGAQNISFLAGNTAILPEIAGDPAAQAVRNAYSTSFNTAMQSVLAGYAANGVTVHYLDLSLVGEQIAANPQAFGLSSAGACAPAPQCIGNTAYTNQFLFYVDNLHLTSAGFAIVAQYIDAQLTAPLVLQAPSDLALDTAEQFGRTMSLRTDLGGRSGGPGVRAFIMGDGFSRKVGASMTNDQFRLSGAGVTAGVELGLAAGVVGIAGNYTRPKARFGNEALKTDGDSYQIGAYGGANFGPLFAQAHVGYGSDKYDITRRGVAVPMDADPDGSHIVAGAKAGYLMPMGIVTLGPVVSLDYARAKIDGYTETGDPALTLNVADQSFKSLTGGLGVELRSTAAVAGTGFRPYGSLMAQKDLSGDSRTLFYSQTASPVIVNRFDYPERSKDVYARLTAGLEASVLGAVSVQAAASTTFGRDDGNAVSGHVGLGFGF
ncbi:autotransporter domain-containing protein [Sphingomonas sabuli]|uniref:Autotransporter domain-containing protein n=1 Tax=Sphingomonas sabuli TaxID=2764186 RepID=A0A7G9L5H7_9SPHN|nr:autotransporter domain-containing protein [Sphingomonas sabuli]QNM83876.1 autotransporter domain-containing protein [Sphingomonas sabuli]